MVDFLRRVGNAFSREGRSTFRVNSCVFKTSGFIGIQVTPYGARGIGAMDSAGRDSYDLIERQGE